MKRKPQPSEQQKQHAGFQKAVPEFLCSVRFKPSIPPLHVGPHIFDPPVHLDDGRTEGFRPGAICYDACSYRYTEMEAAYKWKPPGEYDNYLMTDTQMLDFVVEDDQGNPVLEPFIDEPDEPISDIEPFLVSLQELRENGGKMRPRPQKKMEFAKPQAVVQEKIASAPKIPRTKEEVEEAIERGFNQDLLKFVHPSKPTLKPLRIIPVYSPEHQSISLVTFDQGPLPTDSLLKAVTSPSEGNETFVWMYEPVQGLRSDLWQFVRDYQVQRVTEETGLMAVLVDEQAETAQIVDISSRFSLRRRRSKASDSLRRMKPKMQVERQIEGEEE